MPFSIYIKVSSTEWRPGSRLVKGTDYEELLGEFAKYIADEYKQQLIDAINSQRYKGKWEPLSEEYRKFKSNNGMSENIWEATSFLKDSLDVWKYRDYYIIGVKRNVKYPNSNIPVDRVIRWLEFGTSKMPARPLFLPIKKSISGNIRQYWNRFLTEREDTV